MGSDLINIKDKYGEKMMHLCRKLFSTLLEDDGKLFELMSEHFSYSRYLYDDIVNNSLENNFKNYIYSLIKSEEKDELIEIDKTPFELLDDVGYQLYECKCEEDIQSFKRYYASEEGLCSFRGGRLDTCYVFFAVKKDVDSIKREDFINPMRQDLYGISVISIQFTRGDVNTLSIKNRYNHTVNNPDATFSNNLENIIPGLTRSFEKTYNLNISQNESRDFEIPGYVRTKNGKYYKYNYEINNIYYCPDNIIIEDFEIVDKYREKEKYIIMDYFIIDLVNKRISLYDNTISDCFISDFDNIKNIYITKNRDTKNRMIEITFNDSSKAYIEIDKYNRIVGYMNDNIKVIWNNFLHKNRTLERIELSNVHRIGHGFLASNINLERIEFNKVLEIGDGFLYQNQSIKDIRLDMVYKVGRSFLYSNNTLNNISMFEVECIGDDFLKKNKVLSMIYMPNLISVGDGFLKYNRMLKEINFPRLAYIGDDFITANKIIEKAYLPYLIQVGDNFLYLNRELREINFMYMRYIGNNFMYSNRILNCVKLPLLECVGSRFLYNNNSLYSLDLPELSSAMECFMYNNNSLREIFVPNLYRVGNNFLANNSVLEKINVLNDDIKKRVLS